MKPSEYRNVFNTGIRFHEKTMLIIATKNTYGISRLGLAIAKKNVKKAVDRNRIKRVARESFRHNQSILKGIDIIVVARANMASNNNQVLQKILERNWVRIQSCKQF
ncbi:MAG: ribonuclease P protein component [Gammaproteobacteria bacterium]|nr:ribonuclease P protein component [Gammaproteobacteria bacterium]